MHDNDRDYLRSLLSIIPWCNSNIVADTTPFLNGTSPAPQECVHNARKRSLDHPTFGFAYGWLVFRRNGIFQFVGHALNYRIAQTESDFGQFIDPTPFLVDFEIIGFVPDPLPIKEWYDRKTRMNKLPSSVFHQYFSELLM